MTVHSILKYLDVRQLFLAVMPLRNNRRAQQQMDESALHIEYLDVSQLFLAVLPLRSNGMARQKMGDTALNIEISGCQSIISSSAVP
jgi:hypothetical protein